MPKLEFCQTDAMGTGTDDVYQPVEIEVSANEDGSINKGKPANMHNSDIMTRANAEYLNALFDLQKQIREKYEHQLIPNEKIEGELPVAFCEKLEKLLKPGADNLYYT